MSTEHLQYIQATRGVTLAPTSSFRWFKDGTYASPVLQQWWADAAGSGTGDWVDVPTVTATGDGEP